MRLLILSVDIVILYFDIDSEVPFILRHPFLVIGSSLIYLAIVQVFMRACDKVEVFYVYNEMKLPAIYE